MKLSRRRIQALQHRAPRSISALELTSPVPLRPDADDVPPRSNRARRAARRQQRLSDLTRRGPQLREVSAVGRIVTVDRQDGERTRLTNNSARYEHVLAHNLWVSFETALPQEQFAPREPASNPLSRMIKRRSRVLRRRKRQDAPDKPRVHDGQLGFAILEQKGQ